MDVYVFKSFCLAQLNYAVKVGDVAVNAARGEQSHEVKVASVFDSVVNCVYDRFVILELVVVDCFCDSGELLIYDSARADIGVTYLAVAHLTVGKSDVHSGSADLSKRVFLKEPVKIRGVSRKDCACFFLALLCNSKAVQNHKN